MELRVKLVAKLPGRFGSVFLTIFGLLISASVYAGGSATAPAWVANIEPGTWATVSLNTMADVDPENDPSVNPNFPGTAPWHGTSGQSCVLDCWNGGVYASGYGTHGALLTYGGGHFGYGGSEVYAFDLGTRMWMRASDPYPTPNMNFNYTNGRLPDGSPVPAHTYDYVDYHPGTNSFVLLRAHTNIATASIGLPIAYMLDLDTGTWRNSRRAGDGLALFSGGFSCYDRNRDSFWAMGPFSQARFAKFDPNGNNGDGTYGTWTNYPKDVVDIDGVAECDPIHDVMVYTQFRGNTQMWARDLSNPNAPRVAVTQTGNIPPRSGRHAWEWSDKRQAFIYNLQNSPDVYEFKLDDNDWTRGTWTKLTTSSNSVTPQPMQTQNGIYSRFRLARYGDEEVALLVNRRDGFVYAWRMVAGSGPVVSVSLSAEPRNLSSGGSTTISWTSANATSCTATGAWSGNQATSGQVLLSNVMQTGTYEMTCNGAGGASGHAAVQITVDAPVSNSAPTISGTPETQAAHNEFYSFTPTANDADGDALTFSVTGQPVWASFNTSSGALTGTPGAADIGTPSNVTITVSDGTASATLPTFTLTIIDAGSYGGTLSWLPPMMSADGSALTDLKGYRIYYGPGSANYSDTIEIVNAGLTAYTIEGLSAGTYFFTVAAFDFSENESALAEEIVVHLGAAVALMPPPVIADEPAAAVVDNETAAVVVAEETESSGSATGPIEALLLFFLLPGGVLKKGVRRQLRRC